MSLSGAEMPFRILAVCLGNICRSPAAEAAIAEEASRRGLDVSVESAGTGPWHVGQPPDPQVREAGARVGLAIDGRGRQVTTAQDLEPYDLIVAMDRSTLRKLEEIAPGSASRMRLFRSFDVRSDDDDVPDPYGRTDAAFDETIRIARAAAAGLVDSLMSG